MDDRVFMPQELLDEWSAESKIEIKDNSIDIKELDRSFDVKPAVHFIADVGDGKDAYDLVGRVKDEEQLANLDAEHYMDSVLIGDSAYQVVQGFVGRESGLTERPGKPAAKNEKSDEDMEEKDLLTKFLLENL